MLLNRILSLPPSIPSGANLVGRGSEGSVKPFKLKKKQTFINNKLTWPAQNVRNPVFEDLNCKPFLGNTPRAPPINPFNKSNIHSFPLLTTYSAFEILLKTFSFNDVNSGKLYILDLLKGSMGVSRAHFSKILNPPRLPSPSLLDMY